MLYAEQVMVVGVYDGDTMQIVRNGKKLTIHLTGIDAPELLAGKRKPGQPFSQKSKQHLSALVLNKAVEIQEYGTDRYGRILGVVYLDRININIEMLSAGLAEIDRGEPPKGLDLEPYRKAEQSAKTAGLGVWVLRDQYLSPKDWREMYNQDFN